MTAGRKPIGKVRPIRLGPLESKIEEVKVEDGLSTFSESARVLIELGYKYRKLQKEKLEMPDEIKAEEKSPSKKKKFVFKKKSNNEEAKKH